MDLSIIIPSFNTKLLLDRCLRSIQDSLKTSHITYQITVVDNASKDGTRELLRTKYPRVKTILNTTNLGYGRSNNKAIKESRGEYILLLNSDIVVLEDAIEQLLLFCTNHSNTFVGGKLLNEDLSPQSSCGPFYTIPVVMLLLFFKGDYWGATRYSPDKLRKVDWVSGACLMGKKSNFLEVGLFDEKIFMYMEEIEFLFRARKTGISTYCYPISQFIHTGAASSSNRRSPVINIYRGLWYFYKKHSSPMTFSVLRTLLYIKALLAIGLGRMMGNRDMIQTYEEALSIL